MMKKMLAAASMGCILGASSLFAGTITVTAPIPDGFIPIGTEAVPIGGFNLAGQTLTGVSVTLSLGGNIQAFINNGNAFTVNYTNSNDTTTLSFEGPNSGAIFGPATETCGPNSGTANGSGTNSGVTLETACPFTTGPTTVSPGDLSDYLGTSINMYLADLSDTASGTNGQVPQHSFSYGGGGDISGSLSITYTYSPTVVAGAPEPATLFLMGSALVGVGLLRKRAKKS